MQMLYILLFLLVLAAGYGIFALARLLLRRLLPLKPRLAASIALALGIAFMTAMTISGASLLSSMRESAFAEGYGNGVRESDAANAQDRALAYSEAYTKGYTDAVDGYLSSLLAVLPRASTGESTGDSADEPLLVLLPDKTEEGEDGQDEVPDRSMPDGEETEPAPDEAEPVREKTGITVYYTPSGSVLHFDPNCSHLKNASKVLSCDLADAPERKYCSRCG